MQEYGDIEIDKPKFNMSFHPPRPIKIISTMNINSEELERLQITSMPGFKLNWHFTGGKVVPNHAPEPDPRSSKNLYRYGFVR